MKEMHIANVASDFQAHLQQFELYLLQRQSDIEAWLRDQWRRTPPPIYSSVDLRNSGFKLAPVDTNLFPAGFNNLNKEFFSLYIQTVQSTIEQYYPGCRRVLIIPENHTRNVFYLENLKTLQEILVKSGYEVRFGSLLEEIKEPTTVTLPSGRELCLEPLVRNGNMVGVGNFTSCLIILNNDLSEGVPDILKNLTQSIAPPLQLGWYQRRKTVHFEHYNQVAKEFAELTGMDPWLINPIFAACDHVNFLKREGEEELVQTVDKVLRGIKEKYQTFGIKEKPFVVIKADAGTYGMGVMMVSDAEEVIHLNRKERTRMTALKGHRKITEVIVQEGVYSFETVGLENAVAEPVVYMFGQHVMGGFYRVHTEKSNSQNLNAPGAYFKPLAFSDGCNNPDHCLQPDHYLNRYYAYGVVARLALVAAAREMADLKGKTI